MSTRTTLSALNHGWRVSQEGDTAPAEELWCATPWVEDLELDRSFVSHGAWRCGEIGTIMRRKNFCEGRRTRATCARVETLRLEELRNGGIARREQEVVRRTDTEGELAARRVASHQ